MPKKAEIAKRGVLKGNPGRSSERKEKSRRKSLLFREYIIFTNRMLVEIWEIRAIVMRSQMEMKNILPDSGGKAILVIK